MLGGEHSKVDREGAVVRSGIVDQITGNALPIKQLLGNNKFGLEFYQREYGWREAQVAELVDDLTTRFEDEYDPSHERKDVAGYRPYFLGPIVTASKGGTRYLVDGQQRLTTLSLLLAYLRRELGTFSDDGKALEPLLYSTAFGQKSFNLDVPERDKCMTAILDGEPFDPSDATESVRNLWNRFQDIESRFPEELAQDKRLNFFSDFLLHRVVLVEISAPDQDMALAIFETMNDRGLRLSSTDMLKSFLLSHAGDHATIEALNSIWRRRIAELADADKNADADFVKAWLRGNYAQTQRERKKAATPGDFDIIGTAFHKWVRDNHENMGLVRSDDFRRIVEHNFMRLSDRYLALMAASQTLTQGLEPVFYNGTTGFTLQLPVILAATTADDSDDVFREKARAVAAALDIFVTRRIVNYRNFGYSTVVYTMFNLMKRLRNQPLDVVRQELANWLEQEPERIDGITTLGLNQRNRSHIRYVLARISAWLDTEVGKTGSFADYVDRDAKHPFEVEHIWANHFSRHVDEFDNEHEFSQHRNRLGDLVLLPKDFNASYGDLSYDDKVIHYPGQNPLVRSLNQLAYQNNPSFLRVVNETGFDFHPIEEFDSEAIVERQHLYRQIAEHLWNPEAIGLPPSDIEDPDPSSAIVGMPSERHPDEVAVAVSIRRLSTALDAYGLRDSKARNYVRLFPTVGSYWANVGMRANRVVVTVGGNPFDSAVAATELTSDWTAKGNGLYLTISHRVSAYVIESGAEDEIASSIARLVPEIQSALDSAQRHETDGLDQLPTVDWTVEDYERLARVATNPTVLAAIDLCSERPTTWVSLREIEATAGRTKYQARADLAGLTVLVKKRFNRSNWPIEFGWEAGGPDQAWYRMSQNQADAWEAARREVRIPRGAGGRDREERIAEAKRRAEATRDSREAQAEQERERLATTIRHLSPADATHRASTINFDKSIESLGPEATPMEWSQAVEAARLVTIDAARRGNTITYGELRVAAFEATGMKVGHSMFGRLCMETNRHGDDCLLSSIIVKADTGIPGEGFAPYARSQGFSAPLETLQRQVFDQFSSNSSAPDG